MALTFHHHQLKNGLDIIAEENPDSHSIALGLFVKTGARDEDPKLNGVSHFLEHMMFKGSEKYTWEDVNRIFDEIGARYNASTSQEMTSYYANVLPEYTEQAMAEHFGNHPLSLSILGSPASIMKLTREQMANYFKTRYGPGNMVLAVTGKVDFPQFMKLAEKYCG